MARKTRPNNTGGLRRRKNGTWELCLTIGIDEETGKPKHKSFYARTQAEVLRKGEEYKAEMKKGFPDGNTCTVEEWGATYLEHHAKIAKLAQSTIDANARFFENKDMVPKEAYTMGIQSIMNA